MDKGLEALLMKAETRFPGLESTDIIRRCARWINRSTKDELAEELINSTYDPTSRFETIIIVRSCEETCVDCDDFRALLFSFVTKALDMPQQERFVPTTCGFKPMSESDFVELFNAKGKKRKHGGRTLRIKTTGMVIIHEASEE